MFGKSSVNYVFFLVEVFYCTFGDRLWGAVPPPGVGPCRGGHPGPVPVAQELDWTEPPGPPTENGTGPGYFCL